MVRSRGVYALAGLLAGSIDVVLGATPAFDEIPTKIGYDYTYPISYTGTSGQVKITIVNRNDNNNHIFDVVCSKWLLNHLDAACTTGDNPFQMNIPPRSQQGPYTGYYSLGLLADGADEDTEVYSNSFQLMSHDQAPSPTSSTTSASSTATDPAQSTSSGISSSAPTSTGSGSASDGSLTTGAKAGIGVGAAVGGLLIFGALGFLLYRMGRKSAAAKKDDEEEDAERAEASPAPKEAELAGSDAQSPTTKAAEMDAPAVVHEAPDYKARLETPNNTFMAELDATGGSFVIPTSRPGSALGDKDKSADTANKPPTTAGTDTAMPTVVVTGEEDGDKQGLKPKDALAGSPETIAVSPVSRTSADGDAAFDAATASPRVGSPTDVSPINREGEQDGKRVQTPTQHKEPHFPETPDDVGRGD